MKAKEYIKSIADDIKKHLEDQYTQEVRNYSTNIVGDIIKEEYTEDLTEVYKHLNAIQMILERYEEPKKQEQERSNIMPTYNQIEKLNIIIKELHDIELQIFAENIQPDGRFKSPYKELIFKEVGTTRKQINQLIYIIKKYI